MLYKEGGKLGNPTGVNNGYRDRGYCNQILSTVSKKN